MEFLCYETRAGVCAVAGPSCEGERLQHFASRAFREQVGRCEGLLHTSARLGAAHACTAGLLSVNGVRAQGRRALHSGDLVALSNGAAAPLAGRANKDLGPPRMALSEELGGSPHEADGGSGGRRLNEAFCRYYRDVQAVCAEGEWRECEALFLQPVPLSVRLNRSSSLHSATVRTLREVCGSRSEPVPWMDGRGGAAHVMPAASADAARAALEAVTRLAETGELTLQDSASMLPAVALDPQPGEVVLDLCCAPGSKTCQLVDAMGGLGLLVANDLKRERAERAWARGKVMSCECLVVTATDATRFPALAPGGFDRVLADVPCSSDGIIRKDPGRLDRWTTRSALQSHGLQLAILQRGLRLLRPGGRLVYSTCSLDPIEDEAVVRAALLSVPGASLLPMESVLPSGVRWAEGLSTWRVPSPDFHQNLQSFGAPFEAPELPSTLFPGPAAEAEGLELRRCARVLPTHGRHFGGFFLAALTREVGDEPQSEDHPMPLCARLKDADPGALALLGREFGLCGLDADRLVYLGGRLVALASPEVLALRRPSAQPAAALFEELAVGAPLLLRESSGDGVEAWRVCQEGAARLAALASRRRLLLPKERMARLAREREGNLDGELAVFDMSPGPVLIGCSLGGDDAGELWASGRLYQDGRVELLAVGEVLERYGELLVVPP